MSLEQYFSKFRKNIVGIDAYCNTPFGKKKIVYADWIASGKAYEPLERKMLTDFAPFIANTHTETNFTGSFMTSAYHHAKQLIKTHVNACKDDVLISYGSGMTGVINKFQRILGLRIPESMQQYINLTELDRPVVFVTHMEHHSNQTSWIETICDVVKIEPDANGHVDLLDFANKLNQYKDRRTKIAAVTACSNVTGVFSPYHQIAKMIHAYDGYCFVDFACCAPYTQIDMHPSELGAHLDAIYFSPHKFLGGPGTTGILIFNKELYSNNVPDSPGGGTVKWTNPWNEQSYIDDIEEREDGGTPPFLQTIRIALCIQLKDEMGADNIMNREHELLEMAFKKLKTIADMEIMAGNIEERLGVISFYIKGLHYNFCVKLLNDRYGIQMRGGCSCAGTYAHYLFGIDEVKSKFLTSEIDNGVYCNKPGWIRLSLHPTMTTDELNFILNALEEIALNHKDWVAEYIYVESSNSFIHKSETLDVHQLVMECFSLSKELVEHS
jgi:selenocysteine lyase/cysteine desulfurase